MRLRPKSIGPFLNGGSGAAKADFGEALTASGARLPATQRLALSCRLMSFAAVRCYTFVCIAFRKLI